VLSSRGVAFDEQISELWKVNNDGATGIWATSAVIVDFHGKVSEIGKTGWEVGGGIVAQGKPDIKII